MDFIPGVEDVNLYNECQVLLGEPEFQFLSDVKILRNNEFWMYNKIFFYLQYPFLASELKDCDLIIIVETNFEASLIQKYVQSEEETQMRANDECDKENPAQATFYDTEINSSKINYSDQSSYVRKEAYLCPHCGKEFKEIQKYKDHCGRNPSREISMCSVCQRTFCSPGKLKQHQKVHEDGGKQECSICLKKFKCHRNLHKHYKQHLVKDEFKCNQCFKLFSSLFNLKRHISRSHNSA